MEIVRKSFQGVTNIIRFNWHFYAIALVLISLLFYTSFLMPEQWKISSRLISFLILFSTLNSLLISFYIYDLSDLYTLNWLPRELKNKQLVNIHAGFDETSQLLQSKYKNCTLSIFDFYNEKEHTEISIHRARKTYPAFPNTQAIATSKIPLADDFADNIFLVFAAHEIRNENERIQFFSELNRVLKPSGQIIVVEHLRNFTNFMAYNIGFFHFLSKAAWLITFKKANLNLVQQTKITPFISIFTLSKHGTSS